jgi:hypothetical protein
MSELDSSSESDEDPSIGVGRGRGKVIILHKTSAVIVLCTVFLLSFFNNHVLDRSEFV